MSSISIDEISAVSGFSASHFMRFFKSAMGTSFTSYLSSYRLSMAARLLMLTNDSILDIALSCGYENLSYFNRSFKKRYKKTPSDTAEGLMKHNDLIRFIFYLFLLFVVKTNALTR